MKKFGGEVKSKEFALADRSVHLRVVRWWSYLLTPLFTGYKSSEHIATSVSY